MKKCSKKVSELLKTPLANILNFDFPESMETSNEKRLTTIARKAILEEYYGRTPTGVTVKEFLLLEPSTIKTECVLNGGSYGKKTHNHLRNFFILNGISNTIKYPFMKDLKNDKELVSIKKRLRNREIRDLYQDNIYTIP